MSVITFWTEMEKEIGQTSSTIAVATQMAMEHNCKILLLTTNNVNELKDAFWKRTEEAKRQSFFGSLNKNSQVGINNGMAGIIIAMNSNRLMPENITDYAKAVFKGRLEVLAGADVDEESYRRDILKYYPELIRKANMYYDYVIVDLNKESNSIIEEILKLSNIVAYGINQKNGNLEKYIESLENGYLKDKNNVITYIGRYDRYSKYSAKNIVRALRTKKISVVPYNTLFAESCDEGVAAEYFMRMSTVSNTDRNIDFMNDIRSFIDAILYKEQELKMHHYGRN